MSMAVESIELRKSTVSRSSTKAKTIILVVGIILTIIVGFGIITSLSTDLTSVPTKGAVCTAKVLELAQKGMIREVGGYNGAIYECTHMHGVSSVYGTASS